MPDLPAPLRPVRSGAELDPRFPHQVLLHEGYTYLLSAMDGSIGSTPDEGLFDHDLRLLARHRITVNGQTPTGPASAPVHAERWVSILGIRPGDGSPEGPALPQDTIEVRLDRRLGCGLQERVRLTNHSMIERAADLEISVGVAFRDVTQLREAAPLSGTIRRAWDPHAGALTIRWIAAHRDRTVERGVRIRASSRLAPNVDVVESRAPDEVDVRVGFPCRLAPHGELDVTIIYESLVDGAWRSPVDGSRPSVSLRQRDLERASVRATRPAIETPDATAGAIVERASEDLLGLRNWDLEGAHPGWIVNAGAAKYLGFFGRDALIAGRQAVAFGSAPLRGALERCARSQGRADVPDRDEEPGRIVHEMRRGPLADLGIRPFGRYYGSLTGAAAFVVGLADYWAWTADRETTRRLIPHALAALAWAADASRRHPAGLLASVQRAPRGLRNQGWKDSDEAMRDPDGRATARPNAPVGEQAWWFRALQAAAGLLEAFESPAAADPCRIEAERIRHTIEDDFWLPESGTYAMALGPSGEVVASVGSDPVHLLAAGLPAPDRARRLADRLFAPDLWTGWGLRTLSSQHPAYDPFAYHLGTVWPVESAAFAEGCRRYGFAQELEVVASGLFAAAAHCHQLRLPEVFAGHDQQSVEMPTIYPTTQSPQAWSAGAVLSVMRTLLGLEADAEGGRLIVDGPRLPWWLPVVRIRRLPIGRATVDLQFERRSGGTVDWQVLDATGSIDVEAGPRSAPGEAG
jgi:glycogen debranching enzyme